MTGRIFVMVVTENAHLQQSTFSLLQAAGCLPILPTADETALDALRRTRPDAVLVDCEHPAAVSDRFFDLAGQYGVGVLVYGRETRETDVDLIARQQNVCKLPMPADGTAFAHAVRGAMTS